MKTFDFAPGISLRVIERSGDPWFVAKDVCEALGMATEKTGTGRWLAGLDSDEKQSIGNSDACGMHPQSALVSEPGFYKLVGRSSKPAAKQFQRWVTHEVLPTIRKTGGYMVPSVAAKVVDNPMEALARGLLIA